MAGYLDVLLQPPLPPVLNLIPPLSAWQWLPRSILLLYTTLLTFPLILPCVPLSVLLLSLPPCLRHLRACAPLSLHPDALRPQHSWPAAILRAWIVYAMSGIVWSLTATGAPPRASESDTRRTVFLHVEIYQQVARAVERMRGERSAGASGRLGVKEVRVPPLREDYMRGVVLDVWAERREEEMNRTGVQGFWLTNTLPSARNGSAPAVRVAGTQGIARSLDETEDNCAKAPFEERDCKTVPLHEVDSESSSLADAAVRGVDDQEGISEAIEAEVLSDPTPPPRPSSRSPSVKVDRKVYLFFSGGGYVTGVPLAHAAIYSLARTFPPEASSLDLSGPGSLPRRAVFAPNVRKALSMTDSFPMPLIDALSAYQYLLDLGYRPDEVVLIGNSAGGGMVWSVLAYLSCLVQGEQLPPRSQPTERVGGVASKSLGLPGGVIMVSPWVSLPPAREAETPYPDFANAPQLLNAARSYIARFPLEPAGPDPFASEWRSWRKRAPVDNCRDDLAKAGQQQKNDIDIESGMGSEDESKTHCSGLLAALKRGPACDPMDRCPNPPLTDWLETPIFAHLTSHHPLYSPCSIPPFLPEGKNPASHSPFVQQVLSTIKQNEVKILITSATGEWFHGATRLLAEAVGEAGVDVVVMQEYGLMHCENFLFLAEYGMAGRRLLDAVLEWGNEVGRE